MYSDGTVYIPKTKNAVIGVSATKGTSESPFVYEDLKPQPNSSWAPLATLIYCVVLEFDAVWLFASPC